MQFQRFLQIRESCVLSFALAGDIHFQALGDIPVAFPPYGCRERSLHKRIVSQRGQTEVLRPDRKRPAIGVTLAVMTVCS